MVRKIISVLVVPAPLIKMYPEELIADKKGSNSICRLPVISWVFSLFVSAFIKGGWLRRKMVKVVAVMVLSMLMLLAVGCGGWGRKRLFYLWGGDIGGAMYPIGGGCSSIVDAEAEGVSIRVEVTAGGVENTRLVGKGEMDLGLLTADQAVTANDNTGLFEGENLQIEALGAFYATAVQIVSIDDSIATFHDLVGKSISLGEPGGGGEMYFNKLVEAGGWELDDFDTVYLPYDQSCDQMKDGLLDAAICMAGAPAPAIVQLATTHSVNVIEVTEDLFDELVKTSPTVELAVFEPGIFRGRCSKRVLVKDTASQPGRIG